MERPADSWESTLSLLNRALADHYRVAGRISDALTIEEQLRRLIVFADADNPLLIRLKAR